MRKWLKNGGSKTLQKLGAVAVALLAVYGVARITLAPIWTMARAVTVVPSLVAKDTSQDAKLGTLREFQIHTEDRLGNIEKEQTRQSADLGFLVRHFGGKPATDSDHGSRGR